MLIAKQLLVAIDYYSIEWMNEWITKEVSVCLQIIG